jgi:nucleoid DNA-binding protein
MTKRINQKELAELMHDFSDSYFKYEYQDFLEVFSAVIEQAIKDDIEIKLDNFGKFAPKYSKGLTLKALHSEEMVTYPPGCSLKFTPSKSMQNRIKVAFKKYKEGKETKETKEGKTE